MFGSGVGGREGRGDYAGHAAHRHHLRPARLGQQRGEEVKHYLMDTHSIDGERLLICDTLIETKIESQPAVLLQL